MKIPFTFRLVYHGLRAAVRAGLIVLCAWLFLLPATAEDVEALGAREGTDYPPGLRMMRVAQLVVAVAPPRAYDLIAMGLRQDISPLMVRIMMTQMAAGHVLPASARGNGMPAPQSDRNIEGPRFIKIN